SHFHADHIGALRDFPKATFIYHQNAYHAVNNLKGFAALKAGFLPELIPEDFRQRSTLLHDPLLVSLPEEYAPFATGYKIFKDDSLIAVDLPGHVTGQIGLFLKVTADQRIFFIADACWKRESYVNLVLPHAMSFLTMASKKQYRDTLSK